MQNNLNNDLEKVDRRPIKTRSAKWAQFLTTLFVRLRISPNQISLLSILVSLIGASMLTLEALDFSLGIWPLLLTAICIQLRLLFNMLDGLVAVEGGRQTKTGELFNEIPDRIADTLFLVGAGYATHHGNLGIALGWCASVLAINTAYIRALGARRGWTQDFCGPQAKPHRMFLLTVACFLGVVEKLFSGAPQVLFITLILINLGTLITCVRRTVRLSRHLQLP